MNNLLSIDQVESDVGETGQTGSRGAQGKQGLKGDQGVKGERGQRGETGLTGSTGKIGPQGKSGVKGNTGLIGTPGNDGGTGVSIDTMEIQGLNLVAFFTDGTMQVVGRVVGETGEQGERGIQGRAGSGFRIGGGSLRENSGLPFFFIRKNKTVTIPENRQSLISGERIVEGDLIVLGEAVEI